ncbi:MAG: MFS transporter [Rhodospirillaceae bacterium]|nr:MFS transporter [Rhodospirillaceae bacterium]
MATFRFIITNRRFLGFGLLCTLGANIGQTYFIALFGNNIRNEFLLSHGDFGAVYAIATLMSALAIIWAGRRIDHMDLRLYSAIIIIGLSIAAGAMALTTNILVLVLALFGLRLFGQGLLRHTAVVSMAKYFENTRGRAMSVVSLGYPIGEAIFPIIAVMAIAYLGWRDTWGFIALVMVFVLLPLSQVLLKGHDERHQKYEKEKSEAEKIFEEKNILRDPHFYIILSASLMAPFLLTGVFFHQLALADTKGWDVAWLASSFPAFAGATVFSSLLSGPLVDKLGPGRILPFFLIPLIAAMAVIALGSHMIWVPVYLALSGLTTGASGVLITASWADTYGTKRLGSVRAISSSFTVLSTAISPLLVGLLLDRGVGFYALGIGAMIVAFGALLGVQIPAQRLRNAKKIAKTNMLAD